MDSIDFRETAPRSFTPRTLQAPGLHKTFTGHLTVGVPGTVAGMDLLLRRHGTRSLARSIAPAAALARGGVTGHPGAVGGHDRQRWPRLRLFPAARAQFLRGGRAYPRRDRCCASPTWPAR